MLLLLATGEDHVLAPVQVRGLQELRGEPHQEDTDAPGRRRRGAQTAAGVGAQSALVTHHGRRRRARVIVVDVTSGSCARRQAAGVQLHDAGGGRGDVQLSGGASRRDGAHAADRHHTGAARARGVRPLHDAGHRVRQSNRCASRQTSSVVCVPLVVWVKYAHSFWLPV